MPAPISWTPQMDSRIRQARASGQSWDALVAVLGISRYAIIGRAKDLDVWRPAMPSATVASALGKSNRQPLPPPPRIDATPRVHPPAKDCQWPLNDGRPWLFCYAESVAGVSYCAEHKRRAFAPLAEAQPEDAG